MEDLCKWCKKPRAEHFGAPLWCSPDSENDMPYYEPAENCEKAISENQRIFERGKSCGCEFALLAVKQNPISVALALIEGMYIDSMAKSKPPIEDSPAEWAKGN